MRLDSRLIVLVAAMMLGSTSYAGQLSNPLESSIARVPPRSNPDYPVTQPEYPIELAGAGIQGEVVLGFYVRADGSVDAQSIKVKKSTGTLILDQSAMKEAAQWKFLPATVNGQPVGSEHEFRVVFDVVKSRPESGEARMDAEDFPGTLDGEPGSSFVPLNMEGEHN